MHTNRSGPIVYVYTVCHNEALLLPYFLRHYGSFAEKVIVYDNQSTDGSADIAGSWPKTEVRTLDSGNELRDDLLLEVKNNCWKESRGKADLVIVCDVDEFLYHSRIQAYLKHFGADGDTALRPLGFSMVSHTPPTGCGQIYDETCAGVRDPWSDKVVLFNPNAIEEINYSPGCHKCSPNGRVQIMENRTDVRLLHYRNLGEDNSVQRYRLRAARLSAQNRSEGWGFHYLWPEDTLRRIHRLHEHYAVPVVGATSSWRRYNQEDEVTSWALAGMVLNGKPPPPRWTGVEAGSAVPAEGKRRCPLRILVIGVCASGKTWLGRKIAASIDVPFCPMDDFFLYPGESKGQHSNTRQKVLATQAIEQEEWLIEGAFGYMADWALPRATGLIWIDLPWEEVLDNFWERSTAGSSKSREEILRDQWAGYEWMKGGIEWLRSNFDDENTNWCSRYFHGYLCDCFRGWKRKLSSRNEVTAFAQTCKQQFTDMQREGGRYE